MDLSLRELECFVAVAEELSFTSLPGCSSCRHPDADSADAGETMIRGIEVSTPLRVMATMWPKGMRTSVSFRS